MSPSLDRRALFALGGASALAVATSRFGAAQSSPEAGEWTFVDDRDRTISLPATPEVIVAEVYAAYALWEYGIKCDGIVGYLAGMEFPDEWADVVQFDMEAGIDVEALKLLAPDVMIGFTWEPEKKNDFGAVDEATMPEVFSIAPTLCILAVQAPIDQSIARFEELAAALGAPGPATPVADQRSAFDAAGERIRAAVAAKPGLTAMAISPTAEVLYIANPTVSSELVYLANLGLDLFQPEAPAEYAGGLWQDVSWELAIDYSVDLILTDNRIWAMTIDDLMAHPVFSLLPAAKAGQIAAWPVEFVFTWSALTPWLEAVAEAIEAAEIVTG
jgi:iron complex transport system substrate-binding protein